MNIHELLHKRVLVAEKEQSYASKSTVVEIKILEVSPTGKWVKTQNMNGNKFWRNSSDIVPIEILDSINTDNPNTADDTFKLRNTLIVKAGLTRSAERKIFIHQFGLKRETAIVQDLSKVSESDIRTGNCPRKDDLIDILKLCNRAKITLMP